MRNILFLCWMDLDLPTGKANFQNVEPNNKILPCRLRALADWYTISVMTKRKLILSWAVSCSVRFLPFKFWSCVTGEGRMQCSLHRFVSDWQTTLSVAIPITGWNGASAVSQLVAASCSETSSTHPCHASHGCLWTIQLFSALWSFWQL